MAGLANTLHFDIFRFGHLRKATQLHEELWSCHSLPRQHCWVVMKPQSARFRCCTTCMFYILRMNRRRTFPSLNPNYLLDMAQWRLICCQCFLFFFVKWETWTQQQLWRNVRSFWSRGGCAGTIFSVKRADLWLEQMLTVYLIPLFKKKKKKSQIKWQQLCTFRYQTLQNTQKRKKKCLYEHRGSLAGCLCARFFIRFTFHPWCTLQSFLPWSLWRLWSFTPESRFDFLQNICHQSNASELTSLMCEWSQVKATVTMGGRGTGETWTVNTGSVIAVCSSQYFLPNMHTICLCICEFIYGCTIEIHTRHKNITFDMIS